MGSLSNRRTLALAAAVVFSAGVAAAGGVVPAGAAAPSDRQGEFAAAADEFNVPEELLLAVSYLQSRWEDHNGEYSTSGGFGPMHLTDVDHTRARGDENHHTGDDARGDERRPMTAPEVLSAPSATPQAAESLQTIDTAAALIDVDADILRADPAQNIRGGAALLALYQSEFGALSDDAGDWYGAVARYSQATDEVTAAAFADEVYDVLSTGATMTTDDGVVTLAPSTVEVDTSMVDADTSDRVRTDCPRRLGCEWIPAPYEQYGEGPGDYGNHDQGNRPDDMKIEYIIIHDTEGSYEGTLAMVQDPTYVSWQYTLRSADGHIAQHIRPEDVAWHAGNWSVNSHSIGLEHEGYAADGSWYTEAMYRSSAKLVRYLTDRFDIPRDRAHILGHDNVPGTTTANIRGMHWDTGPYFDWAHYFDLLDAPLKPARGKTQLVTVAPDFETNRPVMIGCNTAAPTEPCPSRPSSTVFLYSEPSFDAPLLNDIGIDASGAPGTIRVNDLSSRAGTGEKFAVADRQGDWTAVWYLGQKGWIHNPADNPTLIPAKGKAITPKRDDIPVYGVAYPEEAAYEGTGIDPVIPGVLPYKLKQGQKYSVADRFDSQYFWAKTLEGPNVVVNGDREYYQIQLGNRVMYVNVEDVRLV